MIDEEEWLDSVDLGEMTKVERVLAAVNGLELDRPPVCFWHHFQPAGSGRKLAEATINFFTLDYDLDIIKIMPDIPYPFPQKSIRTIEDWRLIEPISPEKSRFVTQRVEAVRLARNIMILEPTPVVMTMFSPLCEALHFVQDHQTFFEHLKQDPAVVHEALAILAENLRLQAQQVIEAGADGVFFALQGCTRSIMPESTYLEVGRPYDLLALQGAQNGWLNILHIHGEKDLMFDLVLDYPTPVLSWSDRIAGPSLREARSKTSKCLMGGWNEFGAIAKGPVKEIVAEAQDAINQTNGVKFILAGGCSVPDDTDPEYLAAARDSVDQLDFED